MNPYAPPPMADDPDAQGLPPGVVLPEREPFRRGQLQAQLAVNAVATAGLAGWWWLHSPDRLAAVCAAAGGAVTLFSAIRYLWVRRSA